MGEKVTLLKLSDADLNVVDSMLDKLKQYSMLVDGVQKRQGAAKHFLSALPPGCSLKEKHSFGLVYATEKVGLIDVIDGYPDKSTAFIGLLAVVEGKQRQGLGTNAYKLVECFIRNDLRIRKIRLGILDTNPVQDFWRKQGFVSTGETRQHEGESVSGTVTVYEKILF